MLGNIILEKRKHILKRIKKKLVAIIVKLAIFIIVITDKVTIKIFEENDLNIRFLLK